MNRSITIMNPNVVSPSNNLVAAIYSSTTPTLPVQSVVLQKPYNSTAIINFVSLPNDIYVFKLWESADTTPTGIIRGNWTYLDGTETSVRQDLYLTFGQQGFTTNVYTDSTLSGWDYSIEAKGEGTLYPMLEYTKTDTSFTINGEPIEVGRIFIVRFTPNVSAAPTTTIQSAKLITNAVTLTYDTKLDSTYTGILIRVAAAKAGSPAINITLPPINSIQNFSAFYFTTGYSHPNTIISCSGVDYIDYVDPFTGNGKNNSIILGVQEILTIVSCFGVWYVQSDLSFLAKVGLITNQYAANNLNAIPLTGGLYNRLQYPRLFNYIANNLGYCTVSESSWKNSYDSSSNYTMKGNFTLGDGTSTFRVPDYTANGGAFIRASNDGRSAGVFNKDGIGQHTHPFNDMYIVEKNLNPSLVPNKQNLPTGYNNNLVVAVLITITII